MNTCPNCGKIAGLHSSILQGCMCQYSMQAPPQRTWIGLTDEEIEASKPPLSNDAVVWELAVEWAQSQLKEKNT